MARHKEYYISCCLTNSEEFTECWSDFKAFTEVCDGNTTAEGVAPPAEPLVAAPSGEPSMQAHVQQQGAPPPAITKAAKGKGAAAAAKCGAKAGSDKGAAATTAKGKGAAAAAAARATGSSSTCRSGGGSGGDDDGGDGGDQKEAFAILFSKSVKLRGLVMLTFSQASSLQDEIKDNPVWAWARNEQNEGCLTACVATVKKSFTEFHRDFLTQDVGKLRMSKTKDFLYVELTTFLDTKSKVEDLQNVCEDLVAKHQASVRNRGSTRTKKG